MKVIEVRFVIEDDQYVAPNGQIVQVDGEWLIETIYNGTFNELLGAVELEDDGFGHMLPTGYGRNFVEGDKIEAEVTKLMKEGS